MMCFEGSDQLHCKFLDIQGRSRFVRKRDLPAHPFTGTRIAILATPHEHTQETAPCIENVVAPICRSRRMAVGGEGRDSNPRWGIAPTPLAGERLQPLGHLSGGCWRRSLAVITVPARTAIFGRVGLAMSSPKNISTRNGTTMGKPTCPSKEISLALEGVVSRIIDKVVDQAQKGRVCRLDANEKDSWLRFLVHQRRRTPDVRPMVNKRMEWSGG